MRELVHTLPINSHLLSINKSKSEFTTIYLARALPCGECFPAPLSPTAILHIVKTGNMILGFSWEEKCHRTLLATRPSVLFLENMRVSFLKRVSPRFLRNHKCSWPLKFPPAPRAHLANIFQVQTTNPSVSPEKGLDRWVVTPFSSYIIIWTQS